jgi:hypothetical protein
MLAREHRESRAKVLASVIMDRAIGLYMLFVVATVAILVTGFWRIAAAYVDRICEGVFLVTALGTLAIATIMAPSMTGGRTVRILAAIPYVGRTLAHVAAALRMYRHRLPAVVLCSLISVGVHCLGATGFYLIARGLFDNVPPLASHLVMVPLSAATGVLPLPLGPFELVIDFLYTHVPSGVMIVKGQGLVTTLTGRLISILTVALGIGSYLIHRRELVEAIHEAAKER